MLAPLLNTKLQIPPPGSRVVNRARLLNILDLSLQPEHRLTLVCTPAGYGKTTLVSSWIHRLAAKQVVKFDPSSILPDTWFVAWITLNDTENDLARFMAYLVAALDNIYSGIGKGILTALQEPKSVTPHLLATLLINDISELDQKFLLVLDDYHTINNPTIHELISFLIEHQPQQMSLVIISRSDPPLPLNRLRARSQLVELRQQDLRFTNDEAAEFLKTKMELSLSPTQLQVLDDRTEGWITALQLAALSLHNTKNPSELIESLSAGYEYIADYLADEVLASLPIQVYTFLLQTSILEQLSGPLCDAVTGHTDSSKTLDWLLAGNLFLQPLDYNGNWYRYHHLFADLLRRRLNQQYAEQVSNLHLKASEWYQQAGYLDMAISHAIAGNNYKLAGSLIEQNGEKYLQRGEASTLIHWIETMPEEVQQIYPLVRILHILAYLITGKPPLNITSVEKFALDPNLATFFPAETMTVAALLYIMKGNPSESIKCAEMALKKLPPDRTFFRCLAADGLGMAYSLLGDIQNALLSFEQTVELTLQTGNISLALAALSNLAGLRFMQGQLHAALASYHQIIDLSNLYLGKSSHAAGKAYLGLGELAYEWNKPDEALDNFSKSAEMLEQFSELGLPIVYLSISRVYAAQNNWTAAQAALEKARFLAQESFTTQLDDQLVDALQVRFWITRGDLEQAKNWLLTNELFDENIEVLINKLEQKRVIGEFQDVNLRNLAYFYLANNQQKQALIILDKLLERAKRKNNINRVIDIYCFRAIALQQADEFKQALDSIEQALKLAKPEKFKRTFIEKGEGMANLLYRTAAAGIYPTYAEELLAEFKLHSISDAMDHMGNLDEPLSDREIEVLSLIAEGLSNQEIARQLYISLSTVKGHCSNIYSKLGVHNRTQAVAAGRNLGLISRND